ncbi:hypothetical protein JW752_01795 [Candidatus Peregrinibacteria bacterium]|nr:hypothetical protein [Candidatus Peregrinibacteria bacterium]
MSEKFDDFDGLIESLEPEVSDADLPKAKGKLAISVRMLMILALMMIAPQAIAKGKKAKASPATASIEHTLTLTSEEAQKTDPWEMDLKKMMEAIPANFGSGIDPFKEMGREQPALFLCDDIPQKHVDDVGLNKDFSSVIFQVGQLVEMGIKDRINAEKGRLKKLPNVVRLLNIAGYKSLDDKVKEIERKVKAGPENTREWHAIAMDLLDMADIFVREAGELIASLDSKAKNYKSVQKLFDMGKKMLDKVRAKLGYHGNFDEKQWKALVGTMLKETESLLKQLKGIGISDAYVTPRSIDYSLIPQSYHTQIKKAIEILEALEKDSKPNLKRWQELQKRMAEINEQIKKTVNRESAMGKKRHRCAQSPEPIGVFSLGGLQKTRGTVDSDKPDYYEEVPQVARPLPYQCSWVDPERGRGPGVVMALKDLEERVKSYIEAGMQRLQAYAQAERSAGIVDDPIQKKRFAMIADGEKEMDAILAEWNDILEKIVFLRRDLEKTAGMELRVALDLRRCNVPVTALEQAAKRNDERGVYTGILERLGYTGEGFADGNYITVTSGQSKDEVEKRAYSSAISAFAGREIGHPRVWKPSGGYHFIISSGEINVFVEKLEAVAMGNGHSMCGIVARLATGDDLQPKK